MDLPSLLTVLFGLMIQILQFLILMVCYHSGLREKCFCIAFLLGFFIVFLLYFYVETVVFPFKV